MNIQSPALSLVKEPHRGLTIGKGPFTVGRSPGLPPEPPCPTQKVSLCHWDLAALQLECWVFCPVPPPWGYLAIAPPVLFPRLGMGWALVQELRSSNASLASSSISRMPCSLWGQKPSPGRTLPLGDNLVIWPPTPFPRGLLITELGLTGSRCLGSSSSLPWTQEIETEDLEGGLLLPEAQASLR